MEESTPEHASATQSSAELKWTLRLKIGVFLLAFNIPFGLTGVGLAATMAAVTGRKAFWSLIGLIVYGLSWAMLGCGVLLAGPQGVQFIRELKRKWFSKK
jgi:hypothetical protein